MTYYLLLRVFILFASLPLHYCRNENKYDVGNMTWEGDIRFVILRL